jgi:DNA helicase HerA-like ATPase
MGELSNTLIGHLIDVQGNVLISTLIEDDQGQTPTVTVGDEDIIVGRIGSYVIIRQHPLQIVAMITRMSEQEVLATPIHQDSDGESIKLPYAKRVVRLTPIGSLNNKGHFERGVGQYPTTGAELHAIGSLQIKKMFERYQKEGFEVGTLTSNPSINVSLHVTNLFGRHLAILGQTGSGKSWTVASLVQNAVAKMPKAHIIILDLHGEYCWKREDGIRHYAFNDSIVRHVDARDLEIPYWLMTYAELCDLLIDQTDFSAHNQTAVFRDALRDQRITEGKRLELDRTTLDTPVYFDLGEIRKTIESRNGLVKNEKTGNMIKGPLTGAFDNFLMRLDSKLNDVRYDFLLKPKIRNTSDSLSELLRDFVGLGNPKVAVTVIDLSSVPFDVRPTVAAQIGRLAFEFNYWNPKYREFPIALICEEAHAYIPRENVSQYAGSRKSMERIAKEGRKYGVGLCVVSQRPHEVSETVLSQCGTYACLRITNPDDQSYVRKLVPESEGELVSILAGLGRGEALVLGEAVPLPTRLHFLEPNPSPNSDDIDFYKNWTDGPDDIDVNTIVKRWRTQER